MSSARAEFASFVRAAQAELCDALERADGAARFSTDRWTRPGGGGGLTRVLEGGALLERAGVNVADVQGFASDAAARAGAFPPDAAAGAPFAAVGLSVVLHPRSPLVPVAHLNVRLLARGAWAGIGGGADLTPCYLFEEDCASFHRALRDACEREAPGAWPAMKRACDAYFRLPHRGEHRGIGGLFFDAEPLERLPLARALPAAFLGAWLAIAERRRDLPYGDREREWQDVRRGRYVEFNLAFDRGTRFGLETGGRAESILMSLPPRARWAYRDDPEPSSPEAALVDVLRHPRDWV